MLCHKLSVLTEERSGKTAGDYEEEKGKGYRTCLHDYRNYDSLIDAAVSGHLASERNVRRRFATTVGTRVMIAMKSRSLLCIRPFEGGRK